MITVTSKTPARVSLFGEYSKLIGESITVAINELYTEVSVRRSNDNFHCIESEIDPDQHFYNDPCVRTNMWCDYVLGCIQLLSLEKYKIPFLQIQIKSNIPMGGGLSSSSALLIGVISSISTYCDLDLSKQMIAELAFRCETEMLGVACGKMDHYSCAQGGIQHLIFNSSQTQLQKLPHFEDMRIIVVDLGKPKASKEIISTVIEAYNRHEPRIKRHIDLERNLIRQALKAKYGTFDSLVLLAKLASDAHQSYRLNLQSSSEEHDRIIEKSIQLGGLGAKISGGGFGGVVLVLTDKTRCHKLAYDLRNFAPFITICDVNKSGVTTRAYEG